MMGLCPDAKRDRGQGEGQGVVRDSTKHHHPPENGASENRVLDERRGQRNATTTTWLTMYRDHPSLSLSSTKRGLQTIRERRARPFGDPGLTVEFSSRHESAKESIRAILNGSSKAPRRESRASPCRLIHRCSARRAQPAGQTLLARSATRERDRNLRHHEVVGIDDDSFVEFRLLSIRRDFKLELLGRARAAADVRHEPFGHSALAAGVGRDQADRRQPNVFDVAGYGLNEAWPQRL